MNLGVRGTWGPETLEVVETEQNGQQIGLRGRANARVCAKDRNCDAVMWSVTALGRRALETVGMVWTYLNMILESPL